MSTFVLPSLYSQRSHSIATPPRSLREARSHGSLLSSVRNLLPRPLATLEDLVTSHDDISRRKADSERNLASIKALLYIKLREATSLKDWQAAADQLDHLEGKNLWKLQHESAEYDHGLVQTRLAQMEDARLSRDPKRMLFLMRTTLTRHLGGMGNTRLYKHTHVGTKELIEQYNASVLDTLGSLLEVTRRRNSAIPDSRYLLEQILQARQAFGRSALLLSGGGTFGMNHIGVVKCLWDTKLLPRIISGASAGSIVCAVLCTRTDDEAPHVLSEFCYGDLDVFTREGTDEGLPIRQLARFLKHGALFDISNLIRVMQNLLGDITFQEAYNRTRRILNICVSSASLYELPRLLNYITAPNVIIWSAVAASCSVPFVFSPAKLLSKDPRTGSAVPWNPSPQCWIDGSVDNDLPMTRLAEMFNVNHFIVSQVNPHVIPFLVNEEDDTEAEVNESTSSQLSPGPGWMHSLASIARDEVMHRMHVLSELGVFPNLLTKTRSILSQKYSGDITICPAIPYSHFPKVLKNPTTEFMLQASLAGERATWPKLSRIQNHCAIELALDDAVQQLRARVAFSPSQVDLRLDVIERPRSSAGFEHGQSSSHQYFTDNSGIPFKTRKSFSSFRSNRHSTPTPLNLDQATQSLDATDSQPSLAKLGASFQLTPKSHGSRCESSDDGNGGSTSPTSLSPEEASPRLRRQEPEVVWSSDATLEPRFLDSSPSVFPTSFPSASTNLKPDLSDPPHLATPTAIPTPSQTPVSKRLPVKPAAVPQRQVHPLRGRSGSLGSTHHRRRPSKISNG